MIKCPCCGFWTIEEKNSEIINEICEVCFWQYDEIAQNNPNKIIGPNKIYLNKAKANFKKFGAIRKRFINSVGKKFEYEL